MKVRHVLENDIVEDISIYKNIYNSYVNIIKDQLDPFYEPNFTFDEFCVRMINNFEGVDEEVTDILETPTKTKYYLPEGKPLTTRLFRAVMQIALDEFKDDKESCEKLMEAIKENEYK